MNSHQGLKELSSSAHMMWWDVPHFVLSKSNTCDLAYLGSDQLEPQPRNGALSDVVFVAGVILVGLIYI